MCHILHLGAKNAKFEYTMAGTKLEAVEYEKDVASARGWSVPGMLSLPG
jgi:hypothetical protein